MPKKLDPKMLTGFVREAHSYLPQIRESLETFQHDATQREVLEEALRYTHTIKGASAMVGLPVLSHMANYAEGTLEEVVSGQHAMDTVCSTWLQQMIDQLEHYLDGLLSGDMQQQALVAEVVQSFRRFKNLPEAGDAAAIKAAMCGQEEEAAALEAQSQDQPNSPTTAVTFDDQTAPVPEPAYVAETPGALDALVVGLDEAFDDDLGIGRDRSKHEVDSSSGLARRAESDGALCPLHAGRQPLRCASTVYPGNWPNPAHHSSPQRPCMGPRGDQPAWRNSFGD